MRAWKHALVLAGALGILGAFLPLIEVQHRGFGFAFSARELSFGMERTHKLIERELPRLVEARLPASVKTGRADILTVAEASRGAALLFVPAVLLVLLGVVGLYRRRVGRLLGALSILLGIASIAGWFGLRYGIDYGLAEAALKRTHVIVREGAHMLIAVGIAAIVIGAGILARPDRGRRAAARMSPPPPPGQPPAQPWQPHVPPPPR